MVLHTAHRGERGSAPRISIERMLHPRSVAVFGAFAPDGPPSCSGLPVTRYSVEDLAAFVGQHWLLLTSEQEQHHTPTGNIQPFTWASFQRVE